MRCGVDAWRHSVVITAGSGTGSSGSIVVVAWRSPAIAVPASSDDRTIRWTVLPARVAACCS